MASRTPRRPNLACGFEHVRQIAYRRSSSLLSMFDEADRQTACMQVKRRYWRRSLALHATCHICSQLLAPKRPFPIEIHCLETPICEDTITWDTGAIRLTRQLPMKTAS